MVVEEGESPAAENTQSHAASQWAYLPTYYYHYLNHVPFGQQTETREKPEIGVFAMSLMHKATIVSDLH